jgi:hypothetical protein
MNEYDLVWNTDSLFIPFSLGDGSEEDIRRTSTAYYLFKIGLRPDGA